MKKNWIFSIHVMHSHRNNLIVFFVTFPRYFARILQIERQKNGSINEVTYSALNNFFDMIQ